MEVLIKGFKCNRCKKEWVPNKNKNKKPIENEPVVCPKCKSHYWNKSRIQ